MFPIIPCTLCGSQENLQRKQVGNMLRDWQKQYPGRIENMFSALQNIVPSHLMDRQHHDFKNIRATGVVDAQGDKAFDADEFVAPLTAPPGAGSNMIATSIKASGLAGIAVVTA